MGDICDNCRFFPLRLAALLGLVGHMNAKTETSDFSGKLLIAMPGMGDQRFEHSVVYMCAHSPEGAMGLIINKPSFDLKFEDLLKQLKIPAGDGAKGTQIYFGGPVEHGRGFVLHTADYAANRSTMKVDDRFGMTATLDILQDIARGAGPASSLMALGYSGWGPGQLEAEIQRNGWLTCDASPEIVFAKENGSKWRAALKSLGVDPLTLSPSAGHA